MIAFFKKLLSGGSSVQSISPQEAQELAKQGAVILDVRSAAERKNIQIKGSQHIPLDQLGGKASTLPKDKTIICQCASGMRSSAAAKQLAAQGFDVRNLKGGMMAWQSAGLPTK